MPSTVSVYDEKTPIGTMSDEDILEFISKRSSARVREAEIEIHRVLHGLSVNERKIVLAEILRELPYLKNVASLQYIEQLEEEAE